MSHRITGDAKDRHMTNSTTTQNAATSDLLLALDRLLGAIDTYGSVSRDDWRVEAARAVYAEASKKEA